MDEVAKQLEGQKLSCIFSITLFMAVVKLVRTLKLAMIEACIVYSLYWDRSRLYA